MLLLISRLVDHGYRTLGEKAAHYDQEYFSKPGQTGIQDDGYADYESIPESEFAWRLQLLDLFHVGKGRLLDVGCATGKFVALVEKAGWHAEGIGISLDNASSDSTPALLGEVSGAVTVIRNERNMGFARACNQGAAAARGDYLVFLNNDTEPQEGWLEALLSRAAEDRIGAVGSRLLLPDRKIQHAGVVIPDTASQTAGACPVSHLLPHARRLRIGLQGPGCPGCYCSVRAGPQQRV
jgi:SAM-dependent methyltransferase